MIEEVASSEPRNLGVSNVAEFGGQPGTICTFYSYKGGVGRSMALANVAFLLSKYGKKVLIVDWDLEAPGLERYFARTLLGSRRNRPGIIDLFDARSRGESMDWRRSLLYATVEGGERVSILHAGLDDGSYLERLRGIDWMEEGVGNYLEQLRVEWQYDFDFVLIDSRTGITDIGGICAIHLPDYLISMFTTTEQSLMGVKETMLRARAAHASLPLDRKKLLIVPLPSRDETNTEYKLAGEWRRRFADELATFFEDWIPADEKPEQVLDVLKIPYVAFWSFGEQLPAAKEDATNPKTLAYSYALVARLLNGKLSWKEVREGRQSTIEEIEQKARIDLQTAEAARAREEAKVLQQTREDEALKAEFAARAKQREMISALASERVNELQVVARQKETYYKQFSVAAFGIAVGIAGLLFYTVLRPSIIFGPDTPLSMFDFQMLSGAVISIILSSSVLVFRKAQRASGIFYELERLDYAFRTRSGVFRDIPPDGAHTLFLERAENIAASLHRGRSANEDEVYSDSPLPQKASRLSASARDSDPAETIAQEDETNREWRSSEPIDVFISYSLEGVAALWLREFRPIFAAWVTEALGRPPNLYFGALGQTDEFSGGQRKLLQDANIFIAIATPRYLRSELSLDLRDAYLQQHDASRLIEIILSADVQSRSERGGPAVDFSDLAFVGEAFTRSERYIEFQQRVRIVAELSAELISAN